MFLIHQWLAEGTSRILRELDMRDFNHHDEERMDGTKIMEMDKAVNFNVGEVVLLKLFELSQVKLT